MEFKGWLESQGRLTVRWMIRRDMPQVLRLLQNHPEFADNPQTEEQLLNMLRDKATIGMVAEEEGNNFEDVIRGVVITSTSKTGQAKMYEISLLVGEDQSVIRRLLERATKLDASSGLSSQTADKVIYIRAHYDMNLLAVLKQMGFQTQADGDFIVGRHTTQPAARQWTPPRFATYQQARNGQPPLEPEEPEAQGNPQAGEDPEPPSDPYGLFKNLPYKD